MTSESVDLFYAVLSNAGSAVKNDREFGKSLFDFFKNIETERGRNEDTVRIACALCGCELICAVRSADSDSERVNSCAGNELFNFFGACVGRIFSCDVNVVFDSCKLADLAFYNYAVSVSIINNFLCERDVLFKRIF